MDEPCRPARPRPTVALLLGGARSGKSALAERLVLTLAGGTPVHYVATAVVDPADADLAHRIAEHRRRRQERFRTVEAGADLAGVLRSLPDEPALVDALGTWLASPAVTPAWAGPGGGPLDGHRGLAAPDGPLTGLVAALAVRRAPTVVVSDEAGLGVHPEHPSGRRWRDALGRTNQAVAAVAGDVWLVVAGRVLPLVAPDALLDGLGGFGGSSDAVGSHGTTGPVGVGRHEPDLDDADPGVREVTDPDPVASRSAFGPGGERAGGATGTNR